MESEQNGLDVGGFGGSAKQVVLVLAVVFAAVLAVVVGRQMSAQAMAVVVGVVCGVAASVPTSLLLFVALTRRDRNRQCEPGRRSGHSNYPPVVVIQGGSNSPGLSGPQAGYWPAPMPGPPTDRQWHIVGGDDMVLDDSRY
jgi:hypothetical protein